MIGKVFSIYILKSALLPFLVLKSLMINFGDKGLEPNLIRPVSGTWTIFSKY